MRFAQQAEASLPSFVFLAKTVNSDLTNVRVLVDGDVVAEKLDGRAISVNPGVHLVRFEAKGYPVVERQLVATEGKQLRPITVQFEEQREISTTASKPARAEPVAEEASSSHTASWILGGLGGACLGGFAYFGLTATSDYNALKDTCGQTSSCTQDQVDGFESKAVVADVLLGVGLASLSAAAVVWVLSDGAQERSSLLMITPQSAGATIALRRRF
jgi:hypothetical protein